MPLSRRMSNSSSPRIRLSVRKSGQLFPLSHIEVHGLPHALAIWRDEYTRCLYPYTSTFSIIFGW